MNGKGGALTSTGLSLHSFMLSNFCRMLQKGVDCKIVSRDPCTKQYAMSNLGREKEHTSWRSAEEHTSWRSTEETSRKEEGKKQIDCLHERGTKKKDFVNGERDESETELPE
tara:strand:+ start:93 stop:428 length:336 start_codon:yes stop_codon:yes gene_type:complete